MIRKIRKIYEHYGEAQLDIAQEELAELIQAISKYRRNKGKIERFHCEEEIADVEIMLQQVMWIIGTDRKTIDEWKEYKIERQLGRIEEE